MNDAAGASAESSWLLWTLGAAVAWLGAQVALAWVHMGRRATPGRPRHIATALAAASLGSALCASSVLWVAAEALAFRLGYRSWAVPALWVGAILGCAPVLAWMIRRQRWWDLLGCAALLAVLAGGLQMGWVMAVGLEPGIAWQPDLVAAAMVLMIVGLCASLWTGFSLADQALRHRGRWRAGAAALFGLTLVSGRELLTSGGVLIGQTGSAYRYQFPATVLGLFCGVLVPLVLSAMAVDVAMRRQQRRRAGRPPSTGAGPGPASSDPAEPRRRRRHRQRPSGSESGSGTGT